MSSLSEQPDVVPACLSFLAIYNPSLSGSESNLDDQIVYHYSKPNAQGVEHAPNGLGQEAREGQEKNERLRQIGLAQGMVEFAKSFSDGEAVDSIETQKSRIILHELEEDWWILAYIDLTRLISPHDRSSNASSRPSTEYSAREVSPPALLLQHLLRAHRMFLLHHASNLSELFARTARTRFCGILKRFWNDFLWSWDVLLTGNPAVDIFNGLKLAAGGELGIGVGEEDWGSGEREVLEGFIGRTEGLVELIVSRFGEAPPEEQPSEGTPETTRTGSAMADWKAAGQLPGPSDGVVFSGIGAISRPSITAISHWAETLYTRGQDAYGAQSNPNATHRRKHRRIGQEISQKEPWHQAGSLALGRDGAQQQRPPIVVPNNDADWPSGVLSSIPPSILKPRARSPQPVGSKQSSNGVSSQSAQMDSAKGNFADPRMNTETMIKYLTLGVYGSKWGIPFSRSSGSRQPPQAPEEDVSRLGKDEDLLSSAHVHGQPNRTPGQFVIGFQGDLEGELEEGESAKEESAELEDRREKSSQESRTMIRTIHVDRNKPQNTTSAGQPNHDDTVTKTYSDRLRVVVYTRRPFMFIFLFELQTDALAIPAFYRSIHHQLGPLQRPLLTSTSPQKVSERLSDASMPKSTASTINTQPLCDLVYDPIRLTVHTSIPNIPEPVTTGAEGLGNSHISWDRVEALNVHSQILHTYVSTRRRSSEIERTCKTSRGWWVVWMRLPHGNEPQNAGLYREAFLIRKASDYTPPTARKPSARFAREASGLGASGSWGPGNLAEGIGIDARQYIEGLLSLNR